MKRLSISIKLLGSGIGLLAGLCGLGVDDQLDPELLRERVGHAVLDDRERLVRALGGALEDQLVVDLFFLI